MSTKKISKFFSLLMIIALLASFGAGTALAQSATGVPGDSPDNAVMPTSSAVNIAPGQWHWYLFRSQVPVGVEKSVDDVVTSPTDATIDATLRTKSGHVDFEVWSADDLSNWRNNVDFEPTGAGTTNESIVDDPLFWRGSFSTNNNYYLIVMNRGTTPASYSLDVMGNVSFPSHLALNAAPQTAIAQTQPPVMTTEEMALTVETPAEAIAAPEMATSYNNAVMPAYGTVRIEPGKWQWYIFTSQKPAEVDKKTGTATIDATLRLRSGTVEFEVWSAGDLNNWRNNVEFEPTGAGTKNESITGDPLFWQGSFTTNNNYYLIVKNRGTGPAFYSLNVTGDVSFPNATSLPIN